MTIASRVLEKLCNLPPAQTRDVVIDRDIRVTMPDGIELLTDHYYPRGGGKLPTILCRSPYGKGFLYAILNAWPFVERGCNVIMQCCRGTYGSGGYFSVHHQEESDARATIDWIKKQDWFNGQLATSGFSYLGYNQWAAARSAGKELKAMSLQVTTSAFHKMFYTGESFSFQNHIGWTYMMKDAHRSRQRTITYSKAVKKTSMFLPLGKADKEAVGKSIHIWQDVIQHSEPKDYGWWNSADHGIAVTKTKAPVAWVGGWYDIFLPWMLKDYTANLKAGNSPYLTIGPWYHLSPRMMFTGVNQSVKWYNRYLFGKENGMRKNPVKIFVMGSNEWKEFQAWPPQKSTPVRWNLQADGGFSADKPSNSSPDRYRYDPADPTPNIGGVLMASDWGPKDNRKLEARKDVLVYTSKPMTEDFEIIGPIEAELYIKSSVQNTDFFVRICDVEPSGRSMNICDGIKRIRPKRPAPQKDGFTKVDIELWPTAYCFRKGHCIRVQVSSGAHPRFSRNTGSGEPIATAVKLFVADQEIYHDPKHPSAVILPVMKK